MIFSEKITELRKRSGLTQEQFGDMIGVSRQAVSKWEMAQSVPDINKVMAIAEFFEVPVDFLLKDDLDLDYLENKPITVSSPDPTRKVITLEEAQDYFATHKKTARLVIITIFLLVLSPVASYFLSLTENEKIVGIGIIIQIIFMLCAAVTIILAVWGEKRKNNDEKTYNNSNLYRFCSGKLRPERRRYLRHFPFQRPVFQGRIAV